MADLRFEPVSGTWVAIARNRNRRPMEFVSIPEIKEHVRCPFCSGHEEATPQAVAAYDAEGNKLTSHNPSQPWLVRVVPNKYPSLNEPGQAMAGGPYQTSQATGIQEVVVPSPRHISSFSELTHEEATVSLQACQERLRQLAEHPSVQHVMLFMNCGLVAGASLGHIHLQIIASPVSSPSLDRRARLNDQHVTERGHSVLRSLLNWEVEQQERIVEETESFFVLCPFASQYPYQTWFLPKRLESGWTDMDQVEREELGRLLRKYVARLETLLDNPAYNVLFHQPPTSASFRGGGYVELLPRLTRAAGYELGTDIWVNPVAPELAAEQLRSAGDA